jgi:hypothetical protein
VKWWAPTDNVPSFSRLSAGYALRIRDELDPETDFAVHRSPSF